MNNHHSNKFINARAAQFLCATFGLLLLTAPTAHADSATDQPQQLRLIEEWFTPPQFALGNETPKPIYTDSELNPDFSSLLNPYPEAMSAMKDAQSSAQAAFGGSIVMLAGTLVMLSDTLNDKNDLENDRFPTQDDDNTGTALTLVIVGALITGISSSNARSSMQKAINIYNTNNSGVFLSPDLVNPRLAINSVSSDDGRHFYFGPSVNRPAVQGHGSNHSPVLMAEFSFRF